MMKNIKIVKVEENVYFVKADTKRFGTQAIMFQGQTEEKCKQWIINQMEYILTRKNMSRLHDEAINIILEFKENIIKNDNELSKISDLLRKKIEVSLKYNEDIDEKINVLEELKEKSFNNKIQIVKNLINKNSYHLGLNDGRTVYIIDVLKDGVVIKEDMFKDKKEIIPFENISWFNVDVETFIEIDKAIRGQRIKVYVSCIDGLSETINYTYDKHYQLKPYELIPCKKKKAKTYNYAEIRTFDGTKGCRRRIVKTIKLDFEVIRSVILDEIREELKKLKLKDIRIELY